MPSLIKDSDLDAIHELSGTFWSEEEADLNVRLLLSNSGVAGVETPRDSDRLEDQVVCVAGGYRNTTIGRTIKQVSGEVNQIAWVSDLVQTQEEYEALKVVAKLLTNREVGITKGGISLYMIEGGLHSANLRGAGIFHFTKKSLEISGFRPTGWKSPEQVSELQGSILECLKEVKPAAGLGEVCLKSARGFATVNGEQHLDTEWVIFTGKADVRRDGGALFEGREIERFGDAARKFIVPGETSVTLWVDYRGVVYVNGEKEPTGVF